MTLREFRLDRLSKAAEKFNADLLVASLPANLDYVSGYVSVGMDVLACTECYALFDAKTNHISIVASIAEVPSIYEVLGNDLDVYCYGSFRFLGNDGNPVYEVVKSTEKNRLYSSCTEALIEAIKATGAKTVAIDENRCPVTTYKKLEEALTGINIFPGSEVFSDARFIKHEDEILGLQQSVAIAEKALAYALNNFRVGMTEFDLERFYKSEVCRLGADTFFFVATAAHRAAFSDTQNTELKIGVGDMIRFDFGCLYKGYCSDIARTASVGAPTEKVAKYYEAVKRGTHDTIAKIKPGMTAEEVFTLAVETTKENGLPQYVRHHCGHGIGVECYDKPSIAMGDKTPLEKNMTFCIETPYYELGWGGVQLEDTIVITDDGARYLSKSSDDLIILEA